MRVILMLVKKEFLQVFRNSLLWKILILAPMAEFLLFPYTADYEIKNVNVIFVDHDRSTMTTDILSTFSASHYFVNQGVAESRERKIFTETMERIAMLASATPYVMAGALGLYRS